MNEEMINSIWTTVSRDPGGNVPALVGLLLITWFGLDRLTNAGIFVLDLALPGALSKETRLRGVSGTQLRAVAYAAISTLIAFVVTTVAEVRLLQMIGMPMGELADHFFSAVLLATGGEGLGRVLELGGAGGGGGGSTSDRPLEVEGSVVLVGSEEVESLGSES